MNYFEQLSKKLESKFNITSLEMDSKFVELGIDSLDLVDLVFEMEEELGVEFEDEELMTIKTVGDLIQLVENKKK